MIKECVRVGKGVLKEKEQQMDFWLPINGGLKKVMESFNDGKKGLDKLAMYCLLHHFKPVYDEFCEVKYRYILTYQAQLLFKVDAKQYLSFLEQSNILQNANVPGYETYYRLTDDYREGRVHTLGINMPSVDKIEKFGRIPTKYISEGDLLTSTRLIGPDYSF